MTAKLAVAATPQQPRPIEPEVEERLRSLGYVAATVSRATLADRRRGDPKDKIGLYNLLKRAAQDSVAGQLDAGIAKVREVLAADPDVIEAYTMLGNMNVKAHRLPDAIAAYQKALAIDPEHEGAAWSLALAYQEAGKLDEARAGFERVRQLNPRDARPLYQLAALSARRGDFAAAAETLEKGLTLARRSVGVSRQAGRSAARTEAARRGADGPARRDRRPSRIRRWLITISGCVYEARGQSQNALDRLPGRDRDQPEAVSAALQPGEAPLARRPGRRCGDALSRRRREEPGVRHRLSVSAPRPCSTRTISRAPSRPPSGAWTPSPRPAWCRSGTTCWPTSTRGWGARRKRPATSRPASAPNAPPARDGHDPPALAGLRVAGRVAVRVRGMRTQEPARTSRGPEPRADHHRHAPRRSARRVRQHDRRDAQSRSARPRGGDGAARVGAGAADAPVAHLPPDRPLPRRARDPRQRVAAACRGRAAARRHPAAPRVPNRRFRLVDRAVQTVRTRPRLRHLRRPVRDWRRRRPLPEYDPETRRHDGGRGRGVAPSARIGTALRVGAPLRSARSLRAARTVRHALRRPACTTARWPGPTNWWAGSTRSSPRPGCATTRCWS